MGVGGQHHAPAVLPPGKKTGTHHAGVWVGLKAGLNGCGKSRLHRNSIPGQYRVAIPTELSRLIMFLKYDKNASLMHLGKASFSIEPATDGTTLHCLLHLLWRHADKKVETNEKRLCLRQLGCSVEIPGVENIYNNRRLGTFISPNITNWGKENSVWQVEKE